MRWGQELGCLQASTCVILKLRRGFNEYEESSSKINNVWSTNEKLKGEEKEDVTQHKVYFKTLAIDVPVQFITLDNHDTQGYFLLH